MTVVVGTQIQGTEGVWSFHPTAFAYQWQSSGNGVTGWADVPGETRSDYITVDADIGFYFRVGVSATNVAGQSSVSYSDAVGPVGGYVPPGAEPTALRSMVLGQGCPLPPEFPTYYRRLKR